MIMMTVSCCSHLSVEQSSIARHGCPLSASSAVVLNLISSHFLILLLDYSFVQCHAVTHHFGHYNDYYITLLHDCFAADSPSALSSSIRRLYEEDYFFFEEVADNYECIN